MFKNKNYQGNQQKGLAINNSKVNVIHLDNRLSFLKYNFNLYYALINKVHTGFESVYCKYICFTLTRRAEIYQIFNLSFALS